MHAQAVQLARQADRKVANVNHLLDLTVAHEELGWLAVERKLSIDEVLNDAVEAFYVGTAAVLSPVTTINYQGIDHPIGGGEPGPRAESLRQVLTEIQLQERPDHWRWVVEVST